MPKIDRATAPRFHGTGYPPPFEMSGTGIVRERVGEAGGLTGLGVNLKHLPPGKWSSQRHWHSHEDEFVFIVDGEVVLVEDAGETVLRAGDCAAFPKGTGDGHHLINRSDATAVILEVGARAPADLTTYSDIDLLLSDRRFRHKDGTPYPATE